MSEPIFANGKWTAKKDPDDKRWFKFGFAKPLADSGTTIHATRLPVAIAVGVVVATDIDVADPIKVVGTDVLVYLGSLDLTNGAENRCTVRVTCANGEQIDGSIWFEREDH